MFDIDILGLAELEGGRPPYRLAYEPIANVFDEFRGYGDVSRAKPTHCKVTLAHSKNPRGVWLTVADDGPGFADERDIWTFFGRTAKRGEAAVSGRFNAGDKQLLALSRQATVQTNRITVEFKDGSRNVTRHREPVVGGTIIQALMPWTLSDLSEIRERLMRVIPPAGLVFVIDDAIVECPVPRWTVNVTLPTVALIDGVLKPSFRKTRVDVFLSNEPVLCELGFPICPLTDVGFPWTLDVQQKVPVPLSRDVVQVSYLYRVIGTVLEQAAMDGVTLLTPEQQGAGFVKDALDWIVEPAALDAAVKSLFGDNCVRQSSDPNAKAAAAGATLVPGRWFGTETRARLDAGGILPTSRDRSAEPSRFAV